MWVKTSPHVIPIPSRNLVVVAIPRSPPLPLPVVLAHAGTHASPHHSPPKHHSERSEAVPMNLAAGPHTPLQPECRRGVPCGRPLVGHPQFCTIFAVIPAQRLPPLSSRMRGPIPIPPPFFPHPTCHSERSEADPRNLVVVAIPCSPHLPLPVGAVREPPVPTHALPVIPALISAVPTQSLPPLKTGAGIHPLIPTPTCHSERSEAESKNLVVIHSTHPSPAVPTQSLPP